MPTTKTNTSEAVPKAVIDAFKFIRREKSPDEIKDNLLRRYMEASNNKGGEINAERNAMTSRGDGRTRTREPPEMIKMVDVVKSTGHHRNTINNLVKKKQFPKPVRPNGTIRYWFKEEVDLWKKGKWRYD